MSSREGTTRGHAPRILLLGGTSEARELAAILSPRTDLALISSLAGRTHSPMLPPGLVRVGGFGGVAGLIAHLTQQRIAAVIDATHPYAAQIGRNAEQACDALKIPLLAWERPAWEPQPGDRWLAARDAHEAAAMVDRAGSRVLLAIGRQELGAFRHCREAWLLVRTIDPPEENLPANAKLMLARGPFSFAAEMQMLKQEAINWVVSKNSGGAATYAKIAAARALGIPVAMLERPRKHSASTYRELEDVLRRLAELLQIPIRGEAAG
jgi:precorrin-6A/cobalt-precorrin-6A reductase